MQLAIITSLSSVIDRLAPETFLHFTKEVHKIITHALDVANYSVLKTEALKILVLLLKKTLVLALDEGIMHDIRSVYLLRVEEALRTDASPEVKSRADEAKRLIMSMPVD